MESLNLLENYQKIDNDIKNTFVDSVDSKMDVKIDYEKKEIDYSWVDIIYESLYYIDNILRNPKKFIVNEEEIVKIELSKKVTVESIIHLTQHTNLIQEYNQKTNDVKPSKILNINKEESLDTYENRFIYTLVRSIENFINFHESDIKNTSYCSDEKEITYKANTKVDNENVKISLSLSSDLKEKNLGVATEDIKEKVKAIKQQLSSFIGGEFMMTLTKLHVPLVHPPIRKTNLILKNTNFRKAEQLWNFFQVYENNNFVLQKDNREYIENGVLKQQFDESFLLNYLALSTLSKDSRKISYEKTMGITINKIIEMMIDSNEFDKKKFNELIRNEYEMAFEKIKRRDNIIINTFSDKFERIEEMIKDASNILV